MTIFGYLFLWALALIGALLFGLASHYSHAHLRAYPDKLIDGFRWRDHFLNGQLNDSYVWWGHYDEAGWWEFDSLRNYLSHAALPVMLVLGYGLAWWGDRAAVVATTCDRLGAVGITPLFCM